MGLTKHQSRARRGELRDLALSWNPIGLAGLPADEYDCVVDLLLQMLERRATEGEIASRLQAELRDHFGLEPDPVRESAFAARVSMWFRERWAGPST